MLSAAEAVKGVQAGDFTAREIIEEQLRRIAEVNPKVNALTSVFGLGAVDADDLHADRARLRAVRRVRR
jgi:Asp-tRNA(Asn)/Glu-tRNA(Gln) amidotransferase A subunit family amidase